MKRNILAVAIGILLFLTNLDVAHAAIVFTNRVSSYVITFSSPPPGSYFTFTDASARYDTSFDAIGDPGDTDSLFLSLKTNHTNFSWTGGGGLTVSNVVEAAGFAAGDLAADGTPGTMAFGFDTPVSTTDFLESWLLLRPAGFLEFSGGGSFIVDPASSFSLNVSVPGDWSSLGTGFHQTQVVSFNPAWTIDEFFTFDGTNTNFVAHIDTYDFENPDLLVRFHGTPEPSTLYLGLIALVVTVICRLRTLIDERRNPRNPRDAFGANPRLS